MQAQGQHGHAYAVKDLLAHVCCNCNLNMFDKNTFFFCAGKKPDQLKDDLRCDCSVKRKSFVPDKSVKKSLSTCFS